MTDIKMLKEEIENSGMTIVAISEKTGIQRATLYNRLKGLADFNASEIVALTEVLRLSREKRDEIFLSE